MADTSVALTPRLASCLPGMRGTAATCFRVAVPTAADARSGKSAGHFRLQELQSDARAPRGDSGSTRRIVACLASRGKRGPQPGRIPVRGVIPDAGYGRARAGAVCARDGPRRGAAGSGLPGRPWRGAFAGTGSGQRRAVAAVPGGPGVIRSDFRDDKVSFVTRPHELPEAVVSHVVGQDVVRQFTCRSSRLGGIGGFSGGTNRKLSRSSQYFS
jgi:hypothetical protein